VAGRETDILRHLKHDAGCLATTMVDYYALPQASGRAWPGRALASNLPFQSKSEAVESALAKEISSDMGWSGPYDNRFIPFVVMHESRDCSSATAPRSRRRSDGQG